MFTKGGCFHKSIYDKRGDAKWDMGIIFETGILMASNSAGTKLKGFDGGMFDVDTFKLVQGTDPQMSTSVSQLLDAVEFNARHEFLPFTQVGDLDDVIGAIETKITVDAIGNTDTTFSASIVSSCNVDNVILDLEDVNNFVVLNNTATFSAITLSAVVYNASTGKYDFTTNEAMQAADVIRLKLSDGTYDVVADTIGNLYKGTSNQVVVSA